mmetsp:Transcript_21726/g.34037  ORF Transcript_21726/g.34037 Transcript_21726/m.34037 type:complete len:269 (+) Transcript_21726:79-885(+)
MSSLWAAASLVLLCCSGAEAFSLQPLSPSVHRSLGTSAPKTLTSRAGAFRLRASVAGSLDTDRQRAKEELVASVLKGNKNGVEASAEVRADVDEKLATLCSLNSVEEPAYALLRPPYDYFDGTFNLLYTNTTGGSSGKVGPFVGDVSQTFLGIRDNDAMGFSRRGIFTNDVQIGPLRISLQARCEAKSETKLNIVFEETSVKVFGFQVQAKEFEVGGKGTRGSWDLRYLDEDIRVLRTNAGNVVVLQRGEPEGGESYMDKQRRLASAP